MWAEAVPDTWINKVIQRCKMFDNTYLFQTKNPARFKDWKQITDKTIYACTLETNHYYSDYMGNAPLPLNRMSGMILLKGILGYVMISIEPIMDFDYDIFLRWIKAVNPEFVSIGADSKRHNLPEPSPEKVESLIKELETFTKVIIKDNLKRLRQELPKEGI